MELSTFFKNNSKVALAFSGGVDSAYLLYMAMKHGSKVQAYFINSEFQPQFELYDAKRMAKYIKADLKIIDVEVLQNPKVAANPLNRCYHCKKIILSTIANRALADGYKTLIDGTNASDNPNDRPGMCVLKELSVLSPLRECGLRKNQIRQLSKEAGLFVWNKPAYACLATRISNKESITKEKLRKIECAEDYMFLLGFSDFRIRMFGACAKVQVLDEQLGLLIKNRRTIVGELKKYFEDVLLDLEVRDEKFH